MIKTEQTAHSDRSEAYQALLDQETRPVPAAMRATAAPGLGSEALSVEPYISRHFHELEKEKLWPRVWQASCRESEIPAAGDYWVHDIAGYSLLLLRDEGGAIRGFMNACLHRGRQLKTGSGNVREISCPFHGFRWNLSGQFQGAPCLWDFPHLDPENMLLSPVKVETWGGWVFANMDLAAPPLAEYLGVVPAHFERWQPEQTFKAVHIKKVVNCNWKLAHEAFIESYHTVATHPQLLPYTGDVISQYDCFSDHISRTMTPMGVASSHLAPLTESQTADQWMAVYDPEEADSAGSLPEGVSARHFLGQFNLGRFSAQYGMELESFCTHAEVLDAILYSVFPNFAPWGGYRPNLTYRFLPYDDDHQKCTMEIMVLMRYDASGSRPPDCPVQFVDADTPLREVEGVAAGFAAVFDQDFSNLPALQKGLHSLIGGKMQLAAYQEVRIRHFRHTLNKYLGK